MHMHSLSDGDDDKNDVPKEEIGREHTGLAGENTSDDGLKDIKGESQT